jgi:hypothetical protein
MGASGANGRSWLVALAALTALAFAASPAMACRSPPEPHELKEQPADAILLTTAKDVRSTAEKRWSQWFATVSVDALIWGKSGEREIIVTDQGPGTCQIVGKPKPGKYYVLYLRRIDGRTYVEAMPFWWAWQSGDPRLAKLMKLFPLSNVREPTAQEANMIDLAEQRSRLLGDYTRIYARTSAGSLRLNFFRSKTPQTLMVDYSEELPTAASCRCDLHEQHIELQDLWEAGKLPPFNP